ncbi:unnamed protein product, partial [Trichobilharzia regenti]
MGVPEPFSGNPSGDVIFSIVEADSQDLFQATCEKIGKFFFFHLSVSFDKPTSHKKRSYHLKIKAVFTSHTNASAKPIRLTNTTEVVVNVLDMHANCPIFSRSLYHFVVPDNISIRESVGKLSASISGSNLNAENLLYVDPSELSIPFRVDMYSGHIFPTRPLKSYYTNTGYLRNSHIGSEFDVFDVSNYSFNVYAASRGGIDGSNCNMVSITTVEIKVAKSKFSDLVIKVQPFEEIKNPGMAGVAYARVHVINPHPSIDSLIILKILEPDMRESIPMVSKSKYKLSLPPEIRMRVSEVAIINSTIGILMPYTLFNMTNTSFVFTDLRSQNEKSKSGEKIRLTKSGSLVVVQSLDLENDVNDQKSPRITGSNIITIPFTVVDGNNLLLSSAAESRVVIEIFDINDMDPVVQNNGSIVEVPENASVNSSVLSIVAHDPDKSHTDLSYILYDAEFLPFSLSGLHHNKLIISKPLDAETMPSEFTVRVKVTDSGIPLPRSVLAVFVIRILDINEHSPVFVEDSCEISLPVTDEGSLLIHTGSSSPSLNIGRYFAEDLDRDGQSSITIHIASSSFSRPCFKVDEQTGDLSVICTYLGSPANPIILNLLASDGTKASKKSCTLSLNLVPIQELAGANFTRRCKSSNIYDELQALKVQKRRFEFLLSQDTPYEIQINRHRPQFPTDLPTRIHILENLPIGTVILKFAASDEDGADYSMAGQIIYGLEALRSVASETEASFVADTDIRQAFVLQPTAELGREYNNNTGTFCCGVSLTVAAPLDREVISSYSLILRACDMGQPQLCTFSPLHIFLDDVDDNVPEFLKPKSVRQSIDVPQISNSPSLPSTHTKSELGVVTDYISVPEDVQPDTILVQVEAVDYDVTSEIRYHLLNYQDTFKIHPRTGKIRLKTKLDRESQAVYEVLVSAVGYPRGSDQSLQIKIPYSNLMQASQAADHETFLSSTTRVRIVVTDVNDNPPVFRSPGLPQESQHMYSNSSGINGVNAWLGSDGYVVYVPEDIPEGAYIT